jgi:DNA mismatch repair protein MutS
VARLAGVPAGVLDRAKEVLVRLEKDEEGLSRKILAGHAAPAAAGGGAAPAPSEPEPAVLQHSLFDLLAEADEGLLDELRELDLDSLPPIAAWQLVERVKRALEKGL